MGIPGGLKVMSQARHFLAPALIAAVAALTLVWQQARIQRLERRLEALPTVPGTATGAEESGASHAPNQTAGGGPAGDIAETLAGALAVPEAPVREAAMRSAGFDAAKQDLETAFQTLDAMEPGTGRHEFLSGLISFVAAHRDPGDALALADALEDERDREAALVSVVSTWTSGRASDSGRLAGLTKQFGLEAGLGMVLAADEAYRPALGAAWMEAFGDTGGRAAMVGVFATKHLPGNPGAALAMGDRLSGFERELFNRVLADSWARTDPGAAWDWALSNLAAGDGSGAGLIPELMPDLVAAGDGAAKAALEALTDPDQRRAAVAAIARATAFQEGTAAAADWAGQLPSQAERDLAYRAIATTAPRGIGAALASRDGFVEVTALIDGGTAAADGRIQPGDRIVAVDPGVGEFEFLYGAPMEHALKLITGEPGTTVKLRVVRDDGSGTWTDQVIELQRQQLVLPGPQETTPNP
jgi:hypothetical protein